MTATPPDYSRTDTVGIDADDTLWHSENRFHEAHQRYHELLSAHVDVSFDDLESRMLATETRNLRLFGYGAKGFTLSLIETAIEITDGAIPAEDIATILSFGKEMLEHPVDLLPDVETTIDRLRADGHRLIVITKGDLWHQESKLAASGIADRFDGVEIVSEKDPATYRSVLERHDVDPERFCMIGNSVRSDVLPLLELGASAIHVPYEFLWAHEAVADADTDPRFATIDSIAEVPDLLRSR
ncbi:HAD family hydrolase [Actinospongicola halichondriae]|uniref:HAD family hydrolase n=1 Tax=Actinospongicola halichondriae TaxID=3236844 RepID=UPI003D41319B